MSQTPALLPRVFLDSSVPDEARLEIQKLYGPRPLKFLAQLAQAWFVIAVAIGTAISVDRWWMTVIAIGVIATRQNVLGLLVHDQAHKLGWKGQKGDSLANLFVAYPLIALSVESYAAAHLTHHKYYFTEKDPDHLRKSGPEWRTPMSKRTLARWFLRDISGLSILKLISGKNAKLESKEFHRTKPTPVWIRPAFLVSLALALTVTHAWLAFLIYWILPIVFILPVIVRWGALTEHVYESEGASIETNSPLIIPSRLDRLLLPNLNFSFHAYHHWYPAVSFSNLPRLHAIYRKYGLTDESQAFHGYRSYLRFITRGDFNA